MDALRYRSFFPGHFTNMLNCNAYHCVFLIFNGTFAVHTDVLFQFVYLNLVVEAILVSLNILFTSRCGDSLRMFFYSQKSRVAQFLS